MQYCNLRGVEPWITVGEPGWGEMILDFIMFEHDVLCLKPSTATGESCAIRYFHIIHGQSDFSVSGARYKLLPKSLTRRLPIAQKLPYNVDLLSWVRGNFFIRGIRSHKIKEIWAVVNMGFFSLLRASEIKQIRQKDVEIGLGNGGRRLTIFIYQSKTDQSRRGFFMTPMETESNVCPARSMIYYMNSSEWGCESNEKLFSDDVEKRIRAIIKRSSTSNGLDPEKFRTHSHRSGGATSMYVRGISIGHIRRFGRWTSDTFRRYLYHDGQAFRFVGSAMVKETGLLDQLQMTQPEPKLVTFEESNVISEDDERFRVGGKRGIAHNAQPSPDTLEANISDVGDWETDEDQAVDTGPEHDHSLGLQLVLPGCRLGSLPIARGMSGEEDDRNLIISPGAPTMVLRPRSHASSDSDMVGEEEGETCVGILIIEEHLTIVHVIANETTSPRSSINPTIFDTVEESRNQETRQEQSRCYTPKESSACSEHGRTEQCDTQSNRDAMSHIAVSEQQSENSIRCAKKMPSQ